MMRKRNESGTDREGNKKPPQKDNLELSTCDVSSKDFKKTWLTLKEVHDKELCRLQAKLNSLRKEQVEGERWKDSKAKIKEMSEQQKVLNKTIEDLREQLRSKRCDHCSVDEKYKSRLQKEFHAIHQKNLKFITKITEEKNKLIEENKMLSAKLKLTQEKFGPFPESDDGSIPSAQRYVPGFTAKEPAEENKMYLPVKLMEQSNIEQMKSGGETEQQQSSQCTIPLFSQEIFEVAETSFEKMSSTSKSSREDTAIKKSSIIFPSTFTPSSKRGHEFEDVSNLSEDKPGQAKKTCIHKTFTERTSPQVAFPLSFPSIAEENPETQVVSKTSKKGMSDDDRISLSPLTQRRPALSSRVFPLDYTSRARSSTRMSRYKTGLLGSGSSFKILPSKQSTLVSNIDESSSESGSGADKPQWKKSPTFGSKIKRKVNMQSRRRR